MSGDEMEVAEDRCKKSIELEKRKQTDAD